MSKISLATRFFIFYQIYLYLIQPVLLFWIILGLMGSSYLFQFELFPHNDPKAMGAALAVLCFTIAVVFGHKFVLSRSFADVKRIAFEVLMSTLISLNNIFYISWDLISLPFEKMNWQPMSKDPNAQLTIRECARVLSSGTVSGIVLLYLGLYYAPYMTLTVAPILVSLIFSILIVFFTSKAWNLDVNLGPKKGGIHHGRNQTSTVAISGR